MRERESKRGAKRELTHRYNDKRNNDKERKTRRMHTERQRERKTPNVHTHKAAGTHRWCNDIVLFQVRQRECRKFSIRKRVLPRFCYP